MDHTKEPWKADGTIIYADYGIQTHIADLDGFTNTPESNAKRISDCVTACAGMIDPDEEITWLCNKVDTQEAELSSLRATLAFSQSRVSDCSDREALLADNVELRTALAEKTAAWDEAWKKIEWLRMALRRQFWRANEYKDQCVKDDKDIAKLNKLLAEKTAQVEKLRDKLTDIHDYGLDRDGETTSDKLGELVDELVQISREALAATAPKEDPDA